MKIIARAAHLAVLSYALLWAAPVGAVEEDQKIGLQTLRRDEIALHRQIANIYLGLYNRGQLPIERVIDERGLPVAILMRDRNLHFGTEFPVEIDALLCELNRPALCDRERPLAPPEQLLDMSSHVGGRLPTYGRWRNGPKSELVLPAIQFEITYEIIKYRKSPGEELGKILGKLQGCEQFDVKEECLAFVDRLNYLIPEYKARDFEGEIEVPALALSAVSDVSCSLVECVGGFDEEAARYAADVFKQTGSGAPTPPVTPGPIPGQDLVAKGAGAFEKLERNLWGGIDARRFAIDSEPMFQSQRTMFEFMDFPWMSEEYPDDYTSRVVVAVVDGPIDGAHCDFAEGDWLTVQEVTPAGVLVASATSTQPAGGPAAAPAPSECPGTVPVPGSVADHGTHVVGIIGARQNGGGVVGVNPYARVQALVTDHSQLRTKEYQDALARGLMETFRKEDLRVVNMSFGYSPVQGASSDQPDALPAATDRLQTVISQLANRVLFVAAAGHQQEGVGTDLSGFCSVYPACLDKPNLLGVVALEGDREAPLVPSWANFGSRLGIGALGADVLSTGQESGFVLLDGSSMASPQVSAVASLLFAKLGSVTPSQVKNRLLACAVPTQELQGRVLSGRLQARCALENPETDRLVLADPPETLFGTLVGGRLAGGAIDQLELFNEEMETTSSRAWQRIYGLRRDPAGLGRLVLWVHQRPNEAHQSQLERHAGLVVAPEQAEIELLFRPLTGPERLVPLSRLVEYVAAIR